MLKLRADAPQRLHEARERAGLSRKQLEDRTKERGFRVSEGQIYNLEKNPPTKPYLRTIYALADALGIDSNHLLEPEQEVAAS